MASINTLFMYSLTIQAPSAITSAVLGQFAGTKEQQIITASGSKLTIHRPDPTQGRVSPLFSQDCFGIIRSLAAFRLAGSNKGMLNLYRIPYAAPRDTIGHSIATPNVTASSFGPNIVNVHKLKGS